MDNPAISETKFDSLEQVQKFHKKNGTFKTLLYQLLRLVPYIILIAIFGIVQNNNSKRLEKIEANITTISSKTNIQISNGVGTEKKISEEITPTVEAESANTLGLSTEFNSDQWIIESMDIDKEGYYCPLVKNFNFWSIWTKDKFPVEFKSAKIRVKIKPYKNNKVIPTIVISYGEYVKNFSPSIFYSLNLFDEDTKTLRLYNNKNDSVSQDWLNELPDITNEMIITIQPRVPSPSERKIVVNPQITYPIIDSGKQTDFKPNIEFSTLLPTVNLEDSNLKKQIGIGTRYGMCFKPISVDIEL